MALKPCSTPGCPQPVQRGRCTQCAAKADAARGTSTERGYTTAGHQRFRDEVLAREPVCKVCYSARSTIADHHPMSRRECLARGLDPNDPSNGRGLCKPCHDRETAEHQPGGWNDRPA